MIYAEIVTDHPKWFPMKKFIRSYRERVKRLGLEFTINEVVGAKRSSSKIIVSGSQNNVNDFVKAFKVSFAISTPLIMIVDFLITKVLVKK
jgi:HD-like signal output (HDOD) protein